MYCPDPQYHEREFAPFQTVACRHWGSEEVVLVMMPISFSIRNYRVYFSCVSEGVGYAIAGYDLEIARQVFNHQIERLAAGHVN